MMYVHYYVHIAFNLQSGLLFSPLVLYRNEMLLRLEELTQKTSAMLIDFGPNLHIKRNSGRGAFDSGFFFRVPNPRGLTAHMNTHELWQDRDTLHSICDQVCIPTTDSFFIMGLSKVCSETFLFAFMGSPNDVVIFHREKL